ncbi:MAG: response regulator [Bacteroidales bacterium]|nr:response regulator [Bacteroidales bacterium]
MAHKKFSILYVDDEEHCLVSFAATFRKDYKIFTAKSGKEGIEMMHNDKINLIITDQRMPEMTGIQFLEKIIPEYPDSIRMILTGFSDIEVIIEAINSGRVFRYITKPWDENELRMTIENARQLYALQVSNKELMTELKKKVEEQEQTLKLFIKYVPEQVIEKTLKNNQGSIFEGELRNIAVLFCDIRGFTPMSEELSPKEVVSFLNDYYATMTGIVKQFNGSVNQLVGDEIFVTFGAPESYPDNEANAVFCGIKMMENLPRLNEKYQKKFEREIQMGIGINYGEVIAGNLGSEDRIRYSVTGDTVNTGKRIESITKEFPNSVLISDTIYQKTKDVVNAKAWEPLYVKGKKDKILVYEVLGRK